MLKRSGYETFLSFFFFLFSSPLFWGMVLMCISGKLFINHARCFEEHRKQRSASLNPKQSNTIGGCSWLSKMLAANAFWKFPATPPGCTENISYIPFLFVLTDIKLSLPRLELEKISCIGSSLMVFYSTL